MSLLTKKEWQALGDQCTSLELQTSLKYESLIEAALLEKLSKVYLPEPTAVVCHQRDGIKSLW